MADKISELTKSGAPYWNAVQDQAAFLTSILEGSTEYSIVAMDLDGTILAWNKGARLIYGYESADVVGRAKASVLYVPKDVDNGLPDQLLAEVSHTGKWVGVLRRMRKNGEQFSAHVTTTLRRDPAGAPSGFTMISRDLSESEHLVQGQYRELSETNTFLNNILESSIEYSIIAEDLNGTILKWNEGAYRTYGYTADEMVGKNNSGILHTQKNLETERVAAALRTASKTGKFEGEFERVRKNGEQFTAQLAITLQRDILANPIGYVIISKDITEQKTRKEQIRRKNEELEDQYRRIQDANRLKSEFLVNMSHELRSPLNSIIGFAQIMYDGKVGAMLSTHKEYLGDILTSSNHHLQLINDVLDLAKVESGKSEFRPETVDLNKLAREVCDVLRQVAANKQIRIKSDVDASLSDVVTDPARLKQVLYNYLSNALKFTPDAGRVTLRFLPEDDIHFRVEVEDTGSGIKPEDISRLFVEFQQLDASTAKKYQGTGLGLALTRRIVESQGGQVGLKSELGKGSVFFAVLPRVMKSSYQVPDLRYADQTR